MHRFRLRPTKHSYFEKKCKWGLYRAIYPSPDIWIRDTSPEALRGSYAGTISDPREQKIALVIHMIGRIAHEANGGEFYYSLGGQKVAQPCIVVARSYLP